MFVHSLTCGLLGCDSVWTCRWRQYVSPEHCCPPTSPYDDTAQISMDSAVRTWYLRNSLTSHVSEITWRVSIKFSVGIYTACCRVNLIFIRMFLYDLYLVWNSNRISTIFKGKNSSYKTVIFPGSVSGMYLHKTNSRCFMHFLQRRLCKLVISCKVLGTPCVQQPNLMWSITG
jgi:hypothetical protein